MTDVGSQITRTCSAISQLPAFQTFIIQPPIAERRWSYSMVWRPRVRLLSRMYSANSFSKESHRTLPKMQTAIDGLGAQAVGRFCESIERSIGKASGVARRSILIPEARGGNSDQTKK